ncbi:MAG: hypothetical protein R2838_04270 [Caldilineaceae bacterium]
MNNDPAITGITFNTARAPYDNKDVRWAMLLAIDISDYSGIAVDGTGVLPAPYTSRRSPTIPKTSSIRCSRGWKSSPSTSATARPSSRSM